jgi:uncharacterized membrane protein YcaP (DUF421 family)
MQGISVPDYVRSLPLVALYTFSIYVFLIASFRLVGRRTLGQLTIIDLVIIVIMGSAVETAMVDGNCSFPAGIVSAGTLLLSNRLFAYLSARSHRFRRLISGNPVLVISNGHLIEEHLKRAGLTEEDVMQALRERGCCEISEVKFAVVEADGEINVVENDPRQVKSD